MEYKDKVKSMSLRDLYEDCIYITDRMEKKS